MRMTARPATTSPATKVFELAGELAALDKVRNRLRGAEDRGRSAQVQLALECFVSLAMQVVETQERTDLAPEFAESLEPERSVALRRLREVCERILYGYSDADPCLLAAAYAGSTDEDAIGIDAIVGLVLGEPEIGSFKQLIEGER